MRVLYLVAHANALSESYIQTEIDWLRRRGVEIAISAEAPAPGGTHVLPIDRELVAVGRSLSESIGRFKPDILHAHWITVPLLHAHTIEASGLPLTVRGHSFDVTIGRVLELAKLQALRRVWLFPHYAETYKAGRLGTDKVSPLPACYDPAIWFPGPWPVEPEISLDVVRVAAGLPRKGIEEFIAVAAVLPKLRFALVLTAARPEWLAGLPRPPNMFMFLDMQREAVVSLLRRSALYLRNYDPGYHRWGMPVSVLEAMACGVPCLLPAVAAESFGQNLAPVPTYYGYGSRLDVIVEAVRSCAESPGPRSAAPTAFTTDAVLPAILREWEGICS